MVTPETPRETPRIIIERDTSIFGPRIVFERESEGIRKVNFVMKYNPNHKMLDCFWPCDKSFNIFKKIIDNNMEGVVWKKIYKDLREGTFGYYRFSFDSRVKEYVGVRAGIDVINTADVLNKDSEIILGKIAKIASETITDQSNLPSNFTDVLKKFVTTSLKPVHK
jgi:hypothetical protein